MTSPDYVYTFKLSRPWARAVYLALAKIESGERLSVEDADALAKLADALEKAGAP